VAIHETVKEQVKKEKRRRETAAAGAGMVDTLHAQQQKKRLAICSDSLSNLLKLAKGEAENEEELEV
jgi:hypothetical protein